MIADALRAMDIGHHRLACPHCAKGTRDSALSVTVESDHIVWHCFRCGQAGAKRNGERPYTLPRVHPALSTAPGHHLTLATHWRDVWSGLGPISGTARQCLEARGCEIPPADGDLRCTESLRHPSGYTGPALVALVTDALTGEPMTLHRTWIKADGKKADIELPRMLLGKHRKQGGVIRLWPDEAVTVGLAVAEGIETALTVATVFRPVWSCIDAGNLGELPVLDGIESLLICADNDRAGLHAAERCAERWYRAGREVRIAKSPIHGEDLNDYARRAA